VGNLIRVQPEVGGLLGRGLVWLLHANKDKGRTARAKQNRFTLTVADQQIRTSYLRPSSKPRSRYQDSSPRGADTVGNRTGSCVATIELPWTGKRLSRRRASRLGGALDTVERATGLGPRKMAFSVLAFTVQTKTFVTMQSRRETRIFGGVGRQRAGSWGRRSSLCSERGVACHWVVCGCTELLFALLWWTWMQIWIWITRLGVVRAGSRRQLLVVPGGPSATLKSFAEPPPAVEPT
jgi:hypothetical protein